MICVIAGNVTFIIKTYLHFCKEDKIVFLEKIGKYFKFIRIGIKMQYRKVQCCMWCDLLFHSFYYFVFTFYYAFSHHRFCTNLWEYMAVRYHHEFSFHIPFCLQTFILFLVGINSFTTETVIM